MFARDNCMNLYPPNTNTHPSIDKGKAQRKRA